MYPDLTAGTSKEAWTGRRIEKSDAQSRKSSADGLMSPLAHDPSFRQGCSMPAVAESGRAELSERLFYPNTSSTRSIAGCDLFFILIQCRPAGLIVWSRRFQCLLFSRPDIRQCKRQVSIDA
jgi:hypothetical protein